MTQAAGPATADLSSADASLATKVARRRTFAIISHPDAGKTTLTEKLLMFGGAIQLAGTVKARKSKRHATSDWLEIEKQRGISVASSVMQFPYRDHVVNLLDTPGHEDFSEDTYRVLTAVDAALMVIDAARGVEAQTIKLLEVCRMRATPVITFINKFDREVREPLELLDEIESVLKMDCAPVTWPVGMGKHFGGVYDIEGDAITRFRPGEEHASKDVERIAGLTSERARALFGADAETAGMEVDLVRGAGSGFDKAAFLAGTQTPVFFGSAINNFGVREVLEALIDWAPSPQPRDGGSRIVKPDESKFSAIVFKIQANMDPQHRDRIAFARVCSGRYTPGLKALHPRSGKTLRIGNAITFMAQERKHLDEAVAGDIIGIHNHGQLGIGDVLTEGEGLHYAGIPYFAPELFRRVRLRDPLRSKQLRQGLQQLGEEGLVQVFTPIGGGDTILGVVGALQFDVVAGRLASEYQVDASFEAAAIHTARWIICDDDKELAAFRDANAHRLATDSSGALTFLAPSAAALAVTTEKWPQITFHNTREIAAA
ncbi:MAG: peptide chain release factor 3 [Gammaproteobacteria bacterium]|nr:peptide chain release factor 3 [Gammaproteobacteria bacterium]